MLRAFAALSFALLLSACSPHPANQLLELHCRGDRVVDAQPATHVERRYRIDLQAAALEDWNFETSRFVRWGKGRVSMTAAGMTYSGELRMVDRRVLVRRQVHFDRSTKRIRDQVQASWGGAMAFEGECQER